MRPVYNLNLCQKTKKTNGYVLCFTVIYKLFFILPFLIGCAPNPGNVPKNEYGLEIIRWKKTYKKMVAIDSTQEMVRLDGYFSPLISNIHYARTDNFTGTILYKKPVLYLRKPVAEKINLARKMLLTQGYDLLFFDAYRPYSVTKKMWKIVPDDRYAANPANGSGHNRGVAVDVSIVYAENKIPVPMPTGYDNFSDTAHHDFLALSETIKAHRQILKSAMEEAGFKALQTEWWHYSLPNAKSFDLLDLNFKKMKIVVKKDRVNDEQH